ncbi:MAG: hypothetical protein Q4F21_13690 [Lachnospiraceae bacterium]|nr:hypothetical protein [Lachnospiraceae bacterium]
MKKEFSDATIEPIEVLGIKNVVKLNTIPAYGGGKGMEKTAAEKKEKREQTEHTENSICMGIYSAMFNGNLKEFMNSENFGSSVCEDEGFLKILEEYEYSGEEAGKALRFAAACLHYFSEGLL